MNIISWDFAYSLFPDLNFIKRIAYDINGGDDTNLERGDHEDPKTKYTRRGWKCEKGAANGETKNLHSLQLAGRRRIGDSYTWTIKVDTNGINAGQPSSVLQHSFFKLEQLEQFIPHINAEPRYSIIHIRPVKSCVLRYEYTKTIEYYDPFAFWASVERNLDDLTHSELLKYHWTERPRLFFRQPGSSDLRYSALANEMAGREPEGWTFYDDQISIWYEQYIKDHPEVVFAEQAKFEREQADLKLYRKRLQKIEREQTELELSLKDEAEILRAEMTEVEREEVELELYLKYEENILSAELEKIGWD